MPHEQHQFTAGEIVALGRDLPFPGSPATVIGPSDKRPGAVVVQLAPRFRMHVDPGKLEVKHDAAS